MDQWVDFVASSRSLMMTPFPDSLIESPIVFASSCSGSSSSSSSPLLCNVSFSFNLFLLLFLFFCCCFCCCCYSSSSSSRSFIRFSLFRLGWLSSDGFLGASSSSSLVEICANLRFPIAVHNANSYTLCVNENVISLSLPSGVVGEGIYMKWWRFGNGLWILIYSRLCHYF